MCGLPVVPGGAVVMVHIGLVVSQVSGAVVVVILSVAETKSSCDMFVVFKNWHKTTIQGTPTWRFDIHLSLWDEPGSDTDASRICKYKSVHIIADKMGPDLEALLLTMEVATGNLLWTLRRPTPRPTAGGPKKCWNTAPVWCSATQERIRLPGGRKDGETLSSMGLKDEPRLSTPFHFPIPFTA